MVTRYNCNGKNQFACSHFYVSFPDNKMVLFGHAMRRGGRGSDCKFILNRCYDVFEHEIVEISGNPVKIMLYEHGYSTSPSLYVVPEISEVSFFVFPCFEHVNLHMALVPCSFQRVVVI